MDKLESSNEEEEKEEYIQKGFHNNINIILSDTLSITILDNINKNIAYIIDLENSENFKSNAGQLKVFYKRLEEFIIFLEKLKDIEKHCSHEDISKFRQQIDNFYKYSEKVYQSILDSKTMELSVESEIMDQMIGSNDLELPGYENK